MLTRSSSTTRTNDRHRSGLRSSRGRAERRAPFVCGVRRASRSTPVSFAAASRAEKALRFGCAIGCEPDVASVARRVARRRAVSLCLRRTSRDRRRRVRQASSWRDSRIRLRIHASVAFRVAIRIATRHVAPVRRRRRDHRHTSVLVYRSSMFSSTRGVARGIAIAPSMSARTPRNAAQFRANRSVPTRQAVRELNACASSSSRHREFAAALESAVRALRARAAACCSSVRIIFTNLNKYNYGLKDGYAIDGVFFHGRCGCRNTGARRRPIHLGGWTSPCVRAATASCRPHAHSAHVGNRGVFVHVVVAYRKVVDSAGRQE